MRHVLLHAQFGCAEVTLLNVNTVVDFLEGNAQVAKESCQLESVVDAEISIKRFLVGIEACLFLHQLRLGVESISIALAVTTELLIDGLVELGQVLRVGGLLTVVLEQCTKNLTIGIIVPCLSIVFDVYMLTLA